MKQDITKLNNFGLVFFFILLYLSLILGFQFNEDSTGGAFLDYRGQKAVSQAFAINFKETLLNYDSFATRHSPILIILLSFFEKINLSDELIRLIHLHFALSLPLGFYFLLKENFRDLNKNYIFLLVGLIFLSPTFRSLAIWPDSRLLGLSAFVYSIIFYFCFMRTNNNLYLILNIFLYTIASYISPNFAVFSLFFFYKYLKKYDFFDKKILIFTMLNILLCLPAFYFIFYLEINFLTKTAAIVENKELQFFGNISNQILIIPTLIFFYYLPFTLTKIINLNYENRITSIILSFLILLICILNFNYQYDYTGGGVFFKISNFFFNNNYLFFVVSFLSIYFVILISYKNFENFLIFFILLISNPQVSIYHKYYDPLLLIILFSLINLDINKINLKHLKNYIFIYLYFTSFLIISFLK